MENSLLSQTLKLLMAHHDIKTAELARRLNLAQPTLHRIVSGTTSRPHHAALQAIADYFEITVNQLKGLEPLTKLNTPGLLTTAIPTMHEVPIIPWDQAADLPIPANYASRQTIVTDAKFGQRAYALVMNDSSMEPLFPIGTTLIIDPDKQPRDRDYIVVKFADQQQATFRQLVIDGNCHYLKATSPDLHGSAMQLVTKKDQYCGVLIQARRNFT